MLLQPPSLINTDGMTTAPSSSLSAASVSAAAGFTIAGRFPVPALRLEAIRFRHPCGAEHWHLAADDDHRAFVVAFRTPPLDSTGLPHILEHTTLCGSKRFPVRDPFFQMLRRSLQTFMNAMTFPDMTAYPFASQVSKDYDNLLDVYLDAVFAPRLDPRDFSQEGHRLEPAASPATAGGPGWQRKGVVYNEMKGAMDSTDAQVEQATATALLTDTCYRHNSGGDPAAIPALKYDDLVAFHARCYRPANAVFVTYGSGDPAAIQRRIGAYLKPEGTPLPPPTVQISPITPSELDVPVPLAAGQDAVDVTATALTWVWDDSSDLDEALTAELLDRLLTGHAGAPLRLALESSGLGRSTGSTGYGSSYRNGLYTAELEGIAEADYPAFPKLVMDCLAKVAMEGVPAEEIEAARARFREGYMNFSQTVDRDQLALVRPGDRIDVLVTFSPTGGDAPVGGRITVTLLQNILVEDVGRAESRPDGGVLLLALNPNEVQYMALASETGEIRVTRRDEGDAAMAPLKAATVKSLFPKDEK